MTGPMPCWCDEVNRIRLVHPECPSHGVVTAPSPSNQQRAAEVATCPNGCNLGYYGTHQGLPQCDRFPRDPYWDDAADLTAPAVATDRSGR